MISINLVAVMYRAGRARRCTSARKALLSPGAAGSKAQKRLPKRAKKKVSS